MVSRRGLIRQAQDRISIRYRGGGTAETSICLEYHAQVALVNHPLRRHSWFAETAGRRRPAPGPEGRAGGSSFAELVLGKTSLGQVVGGVSRHPLPILCHRQR